MAHEYSVQIHDWITEKIKNAQTGIRTAESGNNPAKAQYFAGQLEELMSIRKYLTDRIDLDTQKYYQ